MKRMYLFAFFLLPAAVSTAQIVSTQQVCPCQLNMLPDISSREIKLPAGVFTRPAIDYLQKSRNQQKAAWILLGSGAGLITTAFVFPRGKLVQDGICIGVYCSTKYKNDDLKSAILVAGAASSLASIPFFIVASKNKKRAGALAMVFKMEKTTVLSRGTMTTNSFPAAAIHLNLQQ